MLGNNKQAIIADFADDKKVLCDLVYLHSMFAFPLCSIVFISVVASFWLLHSRGVHSQRQTTR